MTRLGKTAILMAGVVTAAVGLALVAAGLSILPAVLVGLNVATLLCYGFDKRAARAGRRRVPEAALHLLGAVGGTPGAFLGQVLFRHKTRPGRFRRVFWTIVAVQAAVLVTVIYMRKG